MKTLLKEKFIKYILLLMFSISFLHSETTESNDEYIDTYIGAKDIVLLKKIYHFKEYRVEIKRYKVGWDGINDKEYLDDYEVYYTFEVFKKRIKKHITIYKNDFIEMMDTPYKFPYVVIHGANLHEDNDITLLDFSHGYRVVQKMRNTRLNYDRLKNRRSPFLWNKKNSSLFSSYSNPIVISNDGSYYIETFEPVGNARCNSCQKYEKVLYRFNGKRFEKYKTFVWDENSTKKINKIIWEE